MPELARACSHYGCQSTVPCLEHTRRLTRRDKSPRNKLYDTALWRRTSQAVRMAEPLCRRCQAEGRITLATEVHHIVAVKHGGSFLDYANLEPLCHAHHSALTVAGQ